MEVFGVGPTELLMVLIVILVLFGPDKLPDLAKRIGSASREMREGLNTINEQMNSALEASMEIDKVRMLTSGETANGDAIAEASQPKTQESASDSAESSNSVTPM